MKASTSCVFTSVSTRRRIWRRRRKRSVYDRKQLWRYFIQSPSGWRKTGVRSPLLESRWFLKQLTDGGWYVLKGFNLWANYRIVLVPDALVEEWSWRNWNWRFNPTKKNYEKHTSKVYNIHTCRQWVKERAKYTTYIPVGSEWKKEQSIQHTYL